MSWASESYSIWIVATNTNEKLHDWENWKPIFHCLDSLIILSPHRATIRTSQSFKSQSGWLGFGRMVWSQKNNIKWTSKYKGPEYAKEEYQFFDTEIWAPDWNKVEREEIPPDIFIQLNDVSHPIHFSQGLTIALRDKLVANSRKVVEGKIEELLAIIPKSEAFYLQRTWAEKVYKWGYANGLSDSTADSLIRELKG